jgi:hypothetical protein
MENVAHEMPEVGLAACGQSFSGSERVLITPGWMRMVCQRGHRRWFDRNRPVMVRFTEGRDRVGGGKSDITEVAGHG